MKAHHLFLALAAFGLAASVRAADVSGKWTSEFESQIGHLKYVYDLKADGDKLTGKAIRTLDGQTTETSITEGKLTGDDVAFVETVKFQDNEVRIEYQGKAAGDEIKFTRKVGDFATLQIAAHRQKEAAVSAPSATGKWQAEFDTQVGKQKYTYTFKAEGDKLTGRAVGDIAGEKTDTAIQEGKVTGAEIAFVEMVQFQGQEVRVDYTGKLEGDEIKFTRKVGDVATEQMVARRVKEQEAK